MVINKLDYFGIVILNTNVEIIFEFAKNHIVSIEQNMGAASLGRKKIAARYCRFKNYAYLW